MKNPFSFSSEENQTDLSLYKPNPSLMSTFEFDDKADDRSLSFDLFKKLVLARKTQDMVFLAIGKILKTIKDRELYKHLDFDTFTQFLDSEEVSFSKEKAYMYIRIYEFYSEKLQLGEDLLKGFPMERLSLMLPQLKKMESKEQQVAEIERVKALRHNDFVRELKQATNHSGKPEVYWSVEANRWIVNYYQNVTNLISLGDLQKEDNE